jgi:FkbM family methyltransferase
MRETAANSATNLGCHYRRTLLSLLPLRSILAFFPARGKLMPLPRLLRPRKRIPFADYGYDVRQFDLPRDGVVEYAQWQHPNDLPKLITQQSVDSVRRFVSPGDFAIDIGAHSGDTTVPMALAAGKGGCTLALEPNPHVFKVLAANAGLNRDKTSIVVRCCAATATDGEFVFHYSDASFCNGGFRSQQRWLFYRRKHALKIKGKNLLNMLRSEFAHWLPKLNYIKVDAEGYDRTILESILPILRERRPVIRTEVYRKLLPGERYALFDLLESAGYRTHRFREDTDTVGKALQRRDMTREKHFDVLAIPATN